ncbi:putative purine permease, plant [Medicago truncatula]|uniref:Probable purine permease n=2 Tax=Medicago truncatula TaxID=3880 RepID=A0A396IWQ7_MEDTR|nr:probable purine permease 10 isoform X1 [Medicago truncatula]RHN67377.1 putative purine permease, plant [Medicago truncatula]
MGEAQDLQLQKMELNEAKETFSLEQNSFKDQIMNGSIMTNKKRIYYIKVAIYAALVLVGQSSATLLGRLYYEKGGKSKWMATVVQLAGFPILLPYYFFILSSKKLTTNNNIIVDPNQSSTYMLAFVYVSIGLISALICYLYSLGLMYLPVSTFTLIGSSQLGFNALFSYFLNSLKFTPFIINSLVLLTISSSLLMFQSESSNSTNVSKKMYSIGFICTLVASAGYGLILSLTQLAFKKVVKRQNFKSVMDMIIYQQMVATCITLVGLFASGEWNGIKNEMEDYELGKASYVLDLTFIAITWQVFSIGCVGLIFEVSSLFSNAISVLGMPIVPILAVVFFQDKMHGIKAISMVLAVWGFISYVYQQYLDENDVITETRNTPHISKHSSTLEEGN